jgi:hypothetical protein
VRIKNTLDGSRRRRRRPKCEQFLRLDIRALRDGLLQSGKDADLPMVSPDANRSAIVRLAPNDDGIELFYEWADGSNKPLRISCFVQIDRTSGRYGGIQSWFRCPRCGARRAVLFGFADDGKFGCWGCMDVVYASQDERKMYRLWRKQAKLERELVDGFRRPAGMHWSSFATICKELDAVFARQERVFCDGARALMRRRRWWV